MKMMMMNNEKEMQILTERNAIMQIDGKYVCVVKECTETGFELVSLSERFDDKDEAYRHYKKMQFRFRRNRAEFRRKMRLLDMVASPPRFGQSKNGFWYKIYKRDNSPKRTCYNYGGFKSRTEAELHYLNNRVYILKRIIGSGYEC